MIKVLSHGNRITVKYPVDGRDQEMIDVRFVEEGRSGADAHMSDSSKLLSQIIGQETGLPQLRIHTQPVVVDQIDNFPVGKVFDLFISRGLYSTPQLRQQVGVNPRMVEGRPTFFKTWLDTSIKEDTDHRLTNSELLLANPDAFKKAQVGAADVRVIDFVGAGAQGQSQTQTQAQQQNLESTNIRG